jgi:chromosomal replication initiation ATPase DnaA
MNDDVITSTRLSELYRMRRFLDIEIATERQRLSSGNTAGLIQAAADLYGTTMEAVRGRDNDRSVTSARMIACWLLRETGMSYPEIGRALGRDHTTIMHACRVIAADPARLALARRLLAQEVAA